ncbi:hypothetical protein RJ641_024836 [Dillenia turbinata]|uniref:THO1-MOS11 C-terminal domain-containing protein n=1 Tax=Dillenia turbinata TaxID=194707 RepID=A0AAN8W0E5_9MAGN
MATTAETKNPKETKLQQSANPNKTLTSDPLSSTKDSVAKESEDSKSSADAPVSDTQKKIRRAERFGMPVQLSEEEKRNSRAERLLAIGSRVGYRACIRFLLSMGSLCTMSWFGTPTTLDASKKLEEQKRKARAERFGLSAEAQPEANDEVAKKKARLARFAQAPKTDTVEDEKRKAREIRFSGAISNTSQVNGEGNIEPKAAVAGKASGGG